MEKKTTGIVVVTYNRKILLKECIEALKKQSEKDCFVLVVDNCSTDGTYDYIKDLVDNEYVYYTCTNKNIGGAGGFNFGMKKAMEYSPKYLWLMDDDCIVQHDSLKNLLDFAKTKNDNFGFLSSVVRWKDNDICKMNIQKTSLKDKVTNFDIDQKIKFATFVSFFVRTDVVKEVGLPIKEFFIWGDDLEYSSRVSNKYPSYLVSSSVVIHKSKSNVGSSIVDDKDNLGRYFYAYRNEQYLYKKMGLKARAFYFLKKKLHIYRILKSNVEEKKERINIIKTASKEGKKFNPKIEYYFPKNSEVKVLEFFAEPLAYGGQEMFMLNMLKNFSDTKIIYTIASPFELTNRDLINYKNNGMRVLNYDYKFESKLRKLYIKKSIKKALESDNYDVIHIQSGSIFNLYYCAKIAKKYNVKKVIVHSHAGGLNNFKYNLIKHHSDKIIDKYADIYLGCSLLAAKWKFPKHIIDNNEFLVIDNGLDIKKYSFDSKIREKIRDEYLVKDNETLICHVGRFADSKNQMFLLKIYPKIVELNNNVKFIMVGAGSTKEAFINKTKDLELFDRFIFLENINNVNEIMFASDVLVFPSLYEGFPITLIEAQATGLRFIKSDLITDEALVTDLGCSLSLEDEKAWIDKIIEFSKCKDEREKYSRIMQEAGYDAKKSAEILEDIYRGVNDGKNTNC